MACHGCGGTPAPDNFTGYRAMVSSNIMPDDDGFYHLFGEIPGEPLYTGEWGGYAVYVVAAGTPSQTIFKQDQRAQAIQHARNTGGTLDQYPTANVAQSLIEAAYA